jgi:general secretion pathway protein F
VSWRSRAYRYVAYTETGTLAEGRLEAPSLEDAVEALWERGLTPFETSEDAGPASDRWWKRDLMSPRKPSRREVAAFTREFATLAQSGIPLDDALRIITGQSAKARMQLVVGSLLEAILDGDHLSDAMTAHPETFPNDYLNMVRAGEASGDIARTFLELADLLERRQELSDKITSALIYPCVLIVLALASVAVVMGVLVPNLAPIFAESGRPMPALIAFVVWLAEAWPLILAVFVAIVVGVFAIGLTIARSYNLRLAVDRILIALPVAGTLIAQHDLARFARTLGSLLRAGAPMLAALASACSVVSNGNIASGLEASLEAVRDGQSLSQALSGRPGIPLPVLRMIAVGEETGKLEFMLLRLAVMLEQLSQRRVERLMTLLTPALTIAIAGLVGALILTVMNAILSVNELAVR